MSNHRWRQQLRLLLAVLRELVSGAGRERLRRQVRARVRQPATASSRSSPVQPSQRLRTPVDTETNLHEWLAGASEWRPRQRLTDRPPRATGRAGSPSGGEAVRERYGEGFFSAIGSRGGRTVAYERGSEYLQQIGARGGAATRQKYGREHYAEIGRKGGQASRGRKRPRRAPDRSTPPDGASSSLAPASRARGPQHPQHRFAGRQHPIAQPPECAAACGSQRKQGTYFPIPYYLGRFV